MMQNYPMSMTNMWPYLRQRQTELSTRKEAYARSFLAKFFWNISPISEHLWTSPDNDMQIVIALRCVSPTLSERYQTVAGSFYRGCGSWFPLAVKTLHLGWAE
jgi:hypothetical protein